MNAEIERLFDAAVEMSPERRAEFLSQHCADPQLRREVELLLQHDGGAETFLAQAVGGEAAAVVQGLALSRGQRLGPYSILSVIGRGGMGVVYLAERADGKFKQRVAIKVVQAGLAGTLAARLQQECRILAALEHPNIARLLDAGATGDGQPYFVMEYIAGEPIDRYADQHRLSLSQRVQLMRSVCEAIQFAHQKLVVHRDLKPDNILVTSQGIPKLLDFGIAKVISEAPEDATQTVTRILTPEYGSPEQVRGEMVSTATDIYGLGAVLYKLLTGVAPHQVEGRGAVETLRAISEEDIRRPSSLRPELTGDLDCILQMALRQEPRRRYSSADQFSADLGRWLDGRPVLASPDSIRYRAAKFFKRHWIGVLAAAIVVLALVTGAAVAMWQARRAERRFADVRHLANVFLFDFEQSIHHLTGATKARQLLVKTALEYLGSLSREAGGDPALTRELAVAYEKVGDIQGDPDAGNIGDTSGAVRSYQQSISLRRSLRDAGSADPGMRISLIQVLLKLSAVQQRTRDLDAALRNSEESVLLAQALVQTHVGGSAATQALSSAYSDLAHLFMRKNNVKASLDSARRRVTLSQSIVLANPDDRVAQRDLASAYWGLGDLCEQASDIAGAIGSYQKAIPIFENLSALEPDSADSRRKLMILYAELGTLQFRSGASSKPHDLDAIALLRKAYAVADGAVMADPANAEAVSDLVAIAVRMGKTLGANGQYAEASRALQRAVKAAGELVHRDPDSGENRLNLGIAHAAYGDFFANQDRIPEAIQQRRIAADIFQELVAVRQNDAKVLISQVFNWKNLGQLLAKQGNFGGARAYYALGRVVAEKLAPDNHAFAAVLESIQRADQQAAQSLEARR